MDLPLRMVALSVAICNVSHLLSYQRAGGWFTYLNTEEGVIMNLIMRFVRFLALLVLNLLLSLVAAAFRWLLLPILMTIFRALNGLIFISFAATISGPVQYTDRLASEWTRQLLDLGAPREHIDPIFVFCQLAVGFLVVLGWVVTTLFTVAVLRIVFGLFI